MVGRSRQKAAAGLGDQRASLTPLPVLTFLALCSPNLLFGLHKVPSVITWSASSLLLWLKVSFRLAFASSPGKILLSILYSYLVLRGGSGTPDPPSPPIPLLTSYPNCKYSHLQSFNNCQQSNLDLGSLIFLYFYQFLSVRQC